MSYRACTVCAPHQRAACDAGGGFRIYTCGADVCLFLSKTTANTAPGKCARMHSDYCFKSTARPKSRERAEYVYIECIERSLFNKSYIVMEYLFMFAAMFLINGCPTCVRCIIADACMHMEHHRCARGKID